MIWYVKKSLEDKYNVGYKIFTNYEECMNDTLKLCPEMYLKTRHFIAATGVVTPDKPTLPFGSLVR